MHSSKSDSALHMYSKCQAQERLPRTVQLEHMLEDQRRIVSTYEKQIGAIRETNDFDVDSLVANLIHGDKIDRNVVSAYKNAVRFMKAKLDYILEEVEEGQSLPGGGGGSGGGGHGGG
eukprot:693256-Prorocentrum_minimum.AAC.12